MKRLLLTCLLFVSIIFAERLSAQTLMEATGIAPSGLGVLYADGENNANPSGGISIYLGWYHDGENYCRGIFWICGWSTPTPAPTRSSGMTLDIMVIHDGTRPLPFQLYLLEDPTTFNEPLQNFTIWNDIVFEVTDMPFTMVKIPAGVYLYDPSIGTYGGYEIPVVALGGN